jgi:hypothetical protein
MFNFRKGEVIGVITKADLLRMLLAVGFWAEFLAQVLCFVCARK